MKAFLVALSLLFSATCLANPPPTQPPTFVPDQPVHLVPLPSTSAPDIDDILQSLLGDVHKPSGPTIECKSHPCVPAYRFSDHVDEETVGKFGEFMEAATKAHPDAVMVELNTPGGSMDDGHEMSRMIEHAPFMVVCVVDGTSASMGMYLLASCDYRVMTKRSQLMVHQVSLMAGRGARITQTSVNNAQATIQAATRAYIEWVTHKMKGVTVQGVLQRIEFGREWWMNWEEALQVSAVDKVIDDSPDKYYLQLKQTGKP